MDPGHASRPRAYPLNGDLPLARRRAGLAHRGVLMTRWLSFFGILLAFLAPGRRAPAAERAPAAGAGPRAIAGSLRTARALRARSRDYLAAAVSEYQALLRRSPHHLEAERGLARALRDQGAEEAALPYLRDVADRSRLGVDEARLGWALFRAGHWAEAADAFVNARQRGQNDPETVRGAALAATAARAALDLGPASDDGAVDWAALWLRRVPEAGSRRGGGLPRAQISRQAPDLYRSILADCWQ